MSETNVIVEGRSLSKEFNGNVVLRDVSIRCEAGKAIALVGENGAGKSTLMNILTGSLTPTSGTVLVDGKEVHFTSPHQSKAMGLAFVHQELSLMEEMTVGENIMLGREPRHFGLIDSKMLHRQAEEILRDIGYEIDVHAIVSDIAPSDKQILMGIVMIVNLGIGMITPPVGNCLYVACGMSKRLSFEQISKACIPYIVMLMIALLLITYVEPISMGLIWLTGASAI